MNELPVTLATPADETELMELCKLLHEENGLFSFDEDMVREMLRRAFERRGGIIGVIKVKQIEAFIYMLLSNFWYSKDHHLEELLSFVKPEFRKSHHADSLIAFAQHCSDKLEIPLLIGVLTNSRMEAKVRLYSRKLGNPAGAFFVYGAPHWKDQCATSNELWSLKRHNKKKNGASELLTESMTTTAALPVMPLVN